MNKTPVYVADTFVTPQCFVFAPYQCSKFIKRIIYKQSNSGDIERLEHSFPHNICNHTGEK